MKREHRLPDMILMSRDATDLLERQTRDNCVFADSEGTGVSFKDALSDDVEMDKKTEYRNMVLLWHPAEEKPACVGALLCWCEGDNFFVHEHFCHDDFLWELFIKKYHLTRYSYIANLMPVSLI